MNSMRNGLGMRETEIAKEPSRPWNPHFYAIISMRFSPKSITRSRNFAALFRLQVFLTAVYIVGEVALLLAYWREMVVYYERHRGERA